MQFFDTLRALILVLSATPDETEKAQITQGATDLIVLTKELVASFPGMENFEMNQILLIDPENAPFYELYNQLQQFSQDLVSDPSSAFDYFSNKLVQEKIADLINLAIAVSQRAEQGEIAALLHNL